jgi:hypothetical protein
VDDERLCVHQRSTKCGTRNVNLAKKFSYWDGQQQLDDHHGVLVEAVDNR